MSASAHNQPIDILKKTVIVLFMVAGMLLIHDWASPGEGFDPRGLLALGFVILATYTIGELVEVVGLPHITGYLLAGLVLGSSAAEFVGHSLPGLHLPPPLDEGILSGAIIDQLAVLNDLALALIALTAGGELKLDGLRRGAKQIMGILSAQLLLVPVGAVVTLFGITTFLPQAVPALSSLPMPAIAALGAVIASLAFATSPAATIAVINSTQSKGPMARIVLSTVVLKDVIVVTAFSAATALAVSVLGTGESVSLLVSLGEIAASMAVGVALGGAIHLYLRYIGAELLLFVVAMIYTATFLMEELGGEPALMFIVAGIVVGNFSSQGETLIHEVERLSLPVYVVFFTLAGANLHLDIVVAMAVPAIAMVLVRVGAMYVSTWAGAQLTGAPTTVARYGWLGFVSQAGVVIALATKARETFAGEIGEALFSLILAGVAINEVIGPVMLQWGLGFAGEVGGPTAQKEADHKPGAEGAPALERWTVDDADVAEIWGQPQPTLQPALDEAVEELGQDLRSVARDQTWLPLSDVRRDAEAWLRQLRREFLRIVHRAARRPGTREELAQGLRNDIGELGERWRDLVLDLAARANRSDRWTPLDLVEAVDAHVATLPERFEAPIHPDELAPRPEPRLKKLRRWFLRLRNGIVPIRREVPLRQLARYHFSGEVPARLEGVAALLVNAELHLAARVDALFRLAADGLRAAAHAADDDADSAAREMEELRTEVDEEFKIAMDELEAIAQDGALRVEKVLGTALQRLRRDVRELGTPDLTLRARRYSRVFAERNEGLTMLGPGLGAAREVSVGRLQQLALELELLGFEGRLRDVVRTKTDQLARALRGRGATQVRRVETALGEWLEHAREQLVEPPAARQLAAELRRTVEPVVHQIAEADDVVRSLAQQLSDEVWVNDLLDALRQHAESLTETYEVPTEPPVVGEWSLPSSIPTSELPFRKMLNGFFDITVTRDLLDLTTDLSSKVRRIQASLEELERLVAFNVELSAAELEVHDEDAPVGAEASELVQAAVVGAISRAHEGLAELATDADEVVATAREKVHEAVIGGMDDLRSAVLDGRLAELRGLWARDPARGLARRAKRFSLLLGTQERLQNLARRFLGEDRLLALSSALGLPETGDERDLRSALAPPAPVVVVPLVYRRLFSDHALVAGDLLSGRQQELARLRSALGPGPGFRTAAVTGLDLQAGLALVNAGTRSSNPVRWSPTAPVDVAMVQAWFSELPQHGGRTVILQDLRWLYRRTPHGFAPIRALVRGIVADGGKNAFVILADQAVWDFAVRMSGIEEAMALVLRLRGLSADQLEQALMSRHSMSGLEVEFAGDDDIGWQLQRLLLRGEDRERIRRTAWFRNLHAASAGVLQDALRLWMASIEHVGSNRIRVGSVPRPPVTRLVQLPETDMLTLVECTRQGWIDAAQHALLFQVEEGWSEAHLAQLQHVGLLVPEPDAPGVLRIAPHLRAPLNRALARRGWT